MDDYLGEFIVLMRIKTSFTLSALLTSEMYEIERILIWEFCLLLNKPLQKYQSLLEIIFAFLGNEREESKIAPIIEVFVVVNLLKVLNFHQLFQCQ